MAGGRQMSLKSLLLCTVCSILPNTNLMWRWWLFSRQFSLLFVKALDLGSWKLKDVYHWCLSGIFGYETKRIYNKMDLQMEHPYSLLEDWDILDAKIIYIYIYANLSSQLSHGDSNLNRGASTSIGLSERKEMRTEGVGLDILLSIVIVYWCLFIYFDSWRRLILVNHDQSLFPNGMPRQEATWQGSLEHTQFPPEAAWLRIFLWSCMMQTRWNKPLRLAPKKKVASTMMKSRNTSY